MIKILDISVPMTEGMPLWPGDPPLLIQRISDIDHGALCNVSRFSCGVHTGTHVDAPIHFVKKGAAIDELPLGALVGPAHVFEFSEDIKEIGPRELESLEWASDVERVLFKTRNSSFWAKPKHDFQRDFTAFTVAGARWLSARRGLLSVGIDYLSVQLFHDPSPETHRVLLSAGLALIEGLDLSRVRPGRYGLYCLPINLVGVEGAPARAILVGDD
ncbi:MAG: cyclase family protein [Syntrophorhabdaceae bacterium]